MPLSEPLPREGAIDIWAGLHPWIRAVFMLGAPTVAAGWLIYLMSGSITGDLREIRVNQLAQANALTELMGKFNESRGSQDAKLDILIRLSQTQCVNAAQDVTQRRGCLDAGAR